MRRQEKKDLKRKKILEAAVRIFARDGFHAARIADIALEAHVGHGTIYLYFDTKDAILLTIFEELMGEALAELRETAAKGRDAVEQLRYLMDAQLQMVEEYRDLTELLLIEARYAGRFFRSGALQRIAEYIRLVEEILRRGIEEGRFRRDLDVTSVATYLFAGIEGVLTRWLLEKQTTSPRRQIGAVLDVFLHGVSIASTSFNP